MASTALTSYTAPTRPLTTPSTLSIQTFLHIHARTLTLTPPQHQRLLTLRASLTSLRHAMRTTITDLHAALTTLSQDHAEREGILTANFCKILKRDLSEPEEVEVLKRYKADLEAVGEMFESRKRAHERVAGARVWELKAERERVRGALRGFLKGEGCEQRVARSEVESVSPKTVAKGMDGSWEKVDAPVESPRVKARSLEDELVEFRFDGVDKEG